MSDITQLVFHSVPDLILRSPSAFLDRSDWKDVSSANGGTAPRVTFGNGDTYYLMSTEVMIPITLGHMEPQGMTSWYISGPSGTYMGTASSFIGDSQYIKGSWIEYAHTSAVRYDGYGFNSFDSSNVLGSGDAFRNVSPKSHVLLGSNTGTLWTLLDTRYDNRPSIGTQFRYQICNPAPYARYRIIVTSITSDHNPLFIDTPLFIGGVRFYTTSERPCIIINVPWNLLSDIKFTIQQGGHIDSGNLLHGLVGMSNASPFDASGLSQWIQGGNVASLRPDSSGGMQFVATYDDIVINRHVRNTWGVTGLRGSEHILKIVESMISFHNDSNNMTPELWSGSSRVQAISSLDARIVTALSTILGTPETQKSIIMALIESSGAANIIPPLIGDGSLNLKNMQSVIALNLDLNSIGLQYRTSLQQRNLVIKYVPLQLRFGPW